MAGFGFRSNFEAGGKFASFDGKPSRRKAKGLYRKDQGTSKRGGTTYPTIIEAYNRDSDYSRWKAGRALAATIGEGWHTFSAHYAVNHVRDFGSASQSACFTLTTFPTTSEARAAWSTVRRERGALFLPKPLSFDNVSIDQSSRFPTSHRIRVNVTGVLSETQLQLWDLFTGSQFEDSGVLDESGYYRLIDDPEDAIAYTLVGIDLEAMDLVFDLSSPWRRFRSEGSNRLYWSKRVYDPKVPIVWGLFSPRYLVSSTSWYCDCPDFSGQATATLEGMRGSRSERFPLPGAGGGPLSSWEEAVAGFRSVWRDVPQRVDQQRACKHIHADRWRIGLPFFEPSDYPVNTELRQFVNTDLVDRLGSELFRYGARRQLELDSAVVAIATAAGITVDTREFVPVPEAGPIGERLPILWTSLEEPSALVARVDDWWLPRGSQVLRVFDPSVNKFVIAFLRAGQLVQPFALSQTCGFPVKAGPLPALVTANRATLALAPQNALIVAAE